MKESKFKVGDIVRFNKKAEQVYGGAVSATNYIVYAVYAPNERYNGYRIRVNGEKAQGSGITQSEEIFSKVRVNRKKGGTI